MVSCLQHFFTNTLQQNFLWLSAFRSFSVEQGNERTQSLLMSTNISYSCGPQQKLLQKLLILFLKVTHFKQILLYSWILSIYI